MNHPLHNWIQHHFNPLHLMCRLINLGLPVRWARKFEKWMGKQLKKKKLKLEPTPLTALYRAIVSGNHKLGQKIWDQIHEGIKEEK